ncbi:MAG: hypothetical protein RAO94_08615 [Candidatus Stygibacter australis]|nr:hypothetical protein [Candidatus Stygibacter australis]MDP8322397.1 hypothetical protein [Candidatus Stygibacter australis]
MNKQTRVNLYTIFILILLFIYQIAYATSSKDNIYRYWIPYVDTFHIGASVTQNYLEIYAFEDSTFIQVETDSFYLNTGVTRIIERPLLCEGLQIISNKPIQLQYYFLTGHYGIYEDGLIMYYILEESFLGTEYWIPTPNTLISVLATQDNTYITVGDDSYNLSIGQTERLYTIPAGSCVSSDKPIMIVAVNYTSDHYGSTFAYEIYPTTFLGTNYFCPHQHPYSYQSSSDSTMLYVMAPWDSTSVTVDSVVFELNQGDYIANTCSTEVSINSTKPVYSIYLSDIYARDPWASDYRHYSYALSLLPFELGIREAIIEPYNTSGHGFPSCEVCIVSLEDNNNIILLTDGIPVDSLFLHYKERAYLHEGEVDGWTTMPLLIQAEASIQVTKTFRKWWNGISESSSGNTVLGRKPFQHDVGVVEIIVPDEEVPIDIEILPTAIIKNFGLNVETFTTSFLIGDIYSDSQIVTLVQSEKDTISFSDWVANPAGTHIVTCTTILEEDEHSSNNMKTSQVTINQGVGPLIYGISPNYGGNTGSLTVEITGSGFEPEAIVKLTKEGQQDIIAYASMTTIIDTSNIIVTFDLIEQELGTWNIVITNSDGYSGTFFNGFEIGEGIDNLIIDIIGSTNVLVGDEEILWIYVENTGNINADLLTIEIIASSNGLISHFPTDMFIWSIAPEDTTFSDTLGYIGYNYPPNDIKLFPFKLTAVNGGSLYLTYQASIYKHNDNSISSRVISNIKADNLDKKLHSREFPPPPPPEGSIVFQGNYLWPKWEWGTAHVGILIYIEGQPCVWENLNDNVGTQFTSWYDFCKRTFPLHPLPFWENYGFWDKYNPNLTDDQIYQLRTWCQENVNRPYSLFFKCTEAIVEAFQDGLGIDLFSFQECITDSPALYYYILTGNDWNGIMGNLYALTGLYIRENIQEYCGEISFITDLEIEITTSQSWDPNDKAGLFGYGELGYIQQNQPLYYIIHFENLDTATANAQNIWITDTLDLNLDWSTLTFDESSHEVETTIDSTSRLITWYFEDINLPPNINSQEGEGWVMFHVNQKPDLPSGTEIFNQASIIFDYNEPMLTDNILNTIDAQPPSSNIIQLSPEQPLLSFIIDWYGEDDEAGSSIKEYSIYVSDNGEPYTHWITSDLTSAIFSGQNKHTYHFYSVAKDNVGNRESIPAGHDAITTIKTAPTMAVSPSPFVPSRGHTEMTFFGAKVAGSEIKVYNKAGEHIITLNAGEDEATVIWDGRSKDNKPVASGVYIWVLTTSSGKQYRDKFAIIK